MIAARCSRRSSLPPLAPVVRAAVRYSHLGPAVRVGPRAVVYPALVVSFWCSSSLLCRVPESRLWVTAEEATGSCPDALLALGRPLSALIREAILLGALMLEAYEEDETVEWPDQEALHG